MQKCFGEGKGPVYRDVLSWLQSSNTQLQLAGALAIANFARNGEAAHCAVYVCVCVCTMWIKSYLSQEGQTRTIWHKEKTCHQTVARHNQMAGDTKWQ